MVAALTWTCFAVVLLELPLLSSSRSGFWPSWPWWAVPSRSTPVLLLYLKSKDLSFLLIVLQSFRWTYGILDCVLVPSSIALSKVNSFFLKSSTLILWSLKPHTSGSRIAVFESVKLQWSDSLLSFAANLRLTRNSLVLLDWKDISSSVRASYFFPIGLSGAYKFAVKWASNLSMNVSQSSVFKQNYNLNSTMLSSDSSESEVTVSSSSTVVSGY